MPQSLTRISVSPCDGRTKTDDVAVRVNEGAFVLPPLRVLWRVHLDARRTPLGRQLVCIVNEQVRSARPAIVFRNDTEVDF